ncbi:NAD(P)/FAD-dependent oxidoreductase [Flavobacterium sp. ASW18X]|uniref:NAD(P)/FAD-dependent oxidoreductase n=1 Tax=Flavobacterium sp. ASW18X TaxID=2572595 RepID=UPI0010AE40C8|nr:NAD(P)/FAD-dependent oxidoreductase [Flavobacterium sp. ASW18X]TKD63634.1 NAD(P)/FAD-dependent oxidoreductase [Flavobacterium sp. ASW18X]
MLDVLIVGGGASGYYCAIQTALVNPHLSIAILERGKSVLSKVKISGGGRCNVTHAEFNPKELTKNYPRGEKELLGPFHSYMTGDVMQFFEERGVALKIEDDGRMFPATDSSQTIIDCFEAEVARLGIQVLKNSAVRHLKQIDSGEWQVQTMNKAYQAKKMVIATGSNPKMWQLIGQLGHTIVAPVPSLFTFNIKDERIKNLQGVATNAQVSVRETTSPTIEIKALKSKKKNDSLLEEEGPVLIAHWGLTGPAVLRLSAWGARQLHVLDYRFTLVVNWLPEYSTGSLLQFLMHCKELEPKKTILKSKVLPLPKRLWNSLVHAAGILPAETWADVNKLKLESLSEQITACNFKVAGKSTFKDEFVTAGGVDLKEVNFKTMQSKMVDNLYFVGEVLNVDAITGGFNFQHAWTSAYLAAQSIGKSF